MIKTNKNNFRNPLGFTLIELLLYISIAGATLLAVVLFSTELLNARVKNQAMAEIDQQGIQIIEIITQAIRNAENINSPALGQGADALSLGQTDINKNPSIFYINNNQLYITEGANLPVVLTNSKIKIFNLSFFNASRSNAPGVVKVEFVLKYNNLENRQEFEYEKTFKASASLR